MAPDSQGVLGAADAKNTLDSESKRVISDETPPGRLSVESSAAGLEQPQDNSESSRRQRRQDRLKSKTKRARHTVTGRHDTIFSVDYGE
jgi:hypothetical protein